MTVAAAAPTVIPAEPGARRSFLVMLGWYGAIVASFGGYVSTLSGAPAGCAEPCDSDRSGVLGFGAYVGVPALFLAFLVSLVVLWRLATRTHIRSAALTGTLSAAPALLVSGLLAAVVVGW
jgi:hypothetical protein